MCGDAVCVLVGHGIMGEKGAIMSEIDKQKTAYIVNIEESEQLRELAQELKRRKHDDRLTMWIVGVCERNLRDYCVK